MKPAQFAAFLRYQSDVVAMASDGPLVADLRRFADFFAPQPKASVKLILVPYATKRSDAMAGPAVRALTMLAKAMNAAGSKPAAEDLELLASALAAAGLTVAEAIELWSPSAAPAPARTARARPTGSRGAPSRGSVAAPPSERATSQRATKGAVDADTLAAAFRAATTDASPERAIEYVDTLSSHSVDTLKSLVRVIAGRAPPSKTKRADLINSLKAPFVEMQIEERKRRSIRLPGAL